MAYLLKCGHVSNAVDGNGEPCCAICAPHPDAHEIECEVHGTYGLEGRLARCSECNVWTESNWELPFFRYYPESSDRMPDRYYCGCRGWD